MDDILDLSGVQSGELALELAPVPLRAVAEETCTMLAGTARDAGVEVLDELGRGDELVVRADRRRLRQVLGNLISNAIKYNRPGGWVRLGAGREGDRVCLRVADSGVGLSAEQCERLFRPFERLGAQRGAVPGTGLGLALSRQLAEAMGGTIEVESRPGEGSVFSLCLPAG
jgi:signal transduction histidine kinase